MSRLSEEQVIANGELVEKLVSKIEDGPRRQRVQEMLSTEVGSQFFTAPASSREDFHGCFTGGLCAHSLRVTDNLRKISAALCLGKFRNDQLVFVGLFHDLGKVGDGVHPLYVPNPSEYGRKRGFLYEVNKDCPYMPTAERGLWILQHHGVQVTQEEWVAIRLNDGMYADENRSYAMREPDLALLLHFADRWACQQEKEEQGRSLSP